MTLAYIIESSIETAAVVAAGGCVFYFMKAHDAVSGAKAVSDNKHRIRRCAAWSGVVQALDLGMQHLCRVHDPLNLMVAWGAANALFSVHRGPRAAVREGVKGAAYGGPVSVALFAILHLAFCYKSKKNSS